MGIFSAEINQEFAMSDKEHINALHESMIYESVAGLDDAQRKAFCESDLAKALMEAGVLRKKTLVRLSKDDDLERRIKMAAIQMSRENDDVLYDQLVKNRVKEKELLNKISNKYVSKATRVAKASQKDYIHNKTKIPIVFSNK